MLKYLTVIEKANHNYSAYLPDIPGCIATGETIEEVKTVVLPFQAIEHIDEPRSEERSGFKPVILNIIKFRDNIVRKLKFKLVFLEA
jgi:hypothetical protein